MTDTTKRNAVLKAYIVSAGTKEAVSRYDHEAMADAIVHLRATVERQDRILAALREPSQAVEDVACSLRWRHAPPFTSDILRAAVAAAEQEVDRG